MSACNDEIGKGFVYGRQGKALQATDELSPSGNALLV
jgi:hypothetical protein